MATATVVTIGHVLREYIHFSDGRRLGPVLGGPAAYSAAAAGKNSDRVGIVTRVSSEDAPDLLYPLQHLGVDLAGVMLGGETRTAVLTYDDTGQKTIRYGAVPPPITFDDVIGGFPSATAYFVCPLDFEVSAETIGLLAKRALVMADLGGLGGAVSSRHPVTDAETAEELSSILQSLDIVKASDEDCEHIVGSKDPVRCASWLNGKGASLALVTCGADGVVVSSRSKAPRRERAISVEVVDSTGAGDSFCGAFLSRYVVSGLTSDAVRYALACASVVVERSGGVRVDRFPSASEIERRLATLDTAERSVE